jgi:purine-binding chemotaxis protein CheW
MPHSKDSLHNMSSNEDILDILRQRDQAQTNLTPSRAEEKLRLLVFRLADEWYGLDATMVQEISRVNQITRLPLTPAHVLGLVNLRGAITGVIDIRATLGLSQAQLEDSARIIVTFHDGLEVGLIAEAVIEMVETTRSALLPPLLTPGADSSKFSTALLQLKDNVPVTVLDLPALLEKLKV